MELTIYFIIAVISAVICYSLTQRKGRNAIGYAVLGFIFPLIGIIVAALIKPAHSS